MKLCHLCINTPDHAFDKALKAEAERSAAALTGEGFPIEVELRYGRGDAQAQLQQLQQACRSPKSPDLFVIIPVDQDTVYSIYSETVKAAGQASCVFLHQALTRPLQLERQARPRRLFSVAATRSRLGVSRSASWRPCCPTAAGCSTSRGARTATERAIEPRACWRSWHASRASS